MFMSKYSSVRYKLRTHQGVKPVSYRKLEVGHRHVPRSLFLNLSPWLTWLKDFCLFFIGSYESGPHRAPRRAATETTFYCKRLYRNDNEDNSYRNPLGNLLCILSLYNHMHQCASIGVIVAHAHRRRAPTATIYLASGMESRLFKCLALINCSRFAYKRPGKRN